MTPAKRFWIGGGGALLPLLVTLLALDLGPIIDHGWHLSLGTYVGFVVRYLVLFALGGIVAVLNSDEIQPIKLMQLGIAAPALVSSYVNAQAPKPTPAQTAALAVTRASFDLPRAARGAIMAPRGEGRILMASFLTDFARAVSAPIAAPIAPAAPQPDRAAVDLAIQNARTSAANAAAAAEKAAAKASKLDQQSTPEAISAVQRSAEDARAAAQKAQSDLKALGEVAKPGAIQ